MTGSASCPRCGATLSPVFPGGSVACACGFTISAAPSSGQAHVEISPGGGIYRRAETCGVEQPSATCPYCGGGIAPLARACPHCDVRLDRVRCSRCFTLHGPSSFACARCGAPLDLEPLLDPTDAPCPRCGAPLEAPAGSASPLAECARCGGIFVPKDELAEILARAEASGTVRAEAPGGAARRLDEVRYLSCPLCHGSMNRVNFGKLSGVIVDVCGAHGTWFDAGELTRVIAFASTGGLVKTRAREEAEKRAILAKAAVAEAELAVEEERARLTVSVGTWRELLRAMFDL